MRNPRRTLAATNRTASSNTSPPPGPVNRHQRRAAAVRNRRVIRQLQKLGAVTVKPDGSINVDLSNMKGAKPPEGEPTDG